jgi:hypothetical protein
MNYLALSEGARRTNASFFTMPELVEGVRHQGIVKSPSIFDINKLTWMTAILRNWSGKKYTESPSVVSNGDRPRGLRLPPAGGLEQSAGRRCAALPKWSIFA